MTDNATTNASNPVYRERLKFYADTNRERNKYFCFDIKSVLTLKEALWRFFGKGWNIRSAWYEKIDLATGEVIENTRLNVQELCDEFCNQKVRLKLTHRSSSH